MIPHVVAIEAESDIAKQIAGDVLESFLASKPPSTVGYWSWNIIDPADYEHGDIVN